MQSSCLLQQIFDSLSLADFYLSSHRRCSDGITPAPLAGCQPRTCISTEKGEHSPPPRPRQRDGHSQDWVALYRKTKKATPFHFLYRLNDQLLLFLSLCLYSPALIHRVWSFTHVHYSLPPWPPLLTLERRQRQWGAKRSRLKRLTPDNAAFFFWFSLCVYAKLRFKPRVKSPPQHM